MISFIRFIHSFRSFHFISFIKIRHLISFYSVTQKPKEAASSSTRKKKGEKKRQTIAVIAMRCDEIPECSADEAFVSVYRFPFHYE